MTNNNSLENMNPEKIVADLKERLATRSTTSTESATTLTVFDKLESQLDKEADIRKQAELKKQLNEEKTKALIATGEKTAYEEDWHKSSVKALLDLGNEIEPMKKQRMDSGLIREIIEKKRSDIINGYTEKAMNQFDVISDWREAYKKQMTQAEYTDPQAEILKRQDWDSKLNALDENGLNDLVNNLQSIELSQYELNTLLSKTNGTDLYPKIMGYAESNHIGKEYETTDAWLNTDSKLAFLQRAKQANDYIQSIDEAGTGVVYDGKEAISNALLGYDVHDGEQVKKYHEENGHI